jgi:hypothetical protein
MHDDYVMKPVDFRQLLEKIHTLLNIEWTYADADRAAPAPAAPSSWAIPPGVVEELIHLGEIGHFRGIQNKLAEIEQGSPAYRDFVAQMRAIVHDVDLRRYVAVLEAMRSSHA